VNGSTDNLETAQEAAIAKVQPAVVQIQGRLAQGESIGSGIIIDNRGDIVTNNHVVNGASSLTVVLNTGKQETAQLVGTDPAHDLAIIRIQPFASMTVAILGDSSQLVVGQEVLAIGSPLGYSGTATTGVVSALDRTAQESNSVTLNGLIQTSAAINPGNSGGALINLQGQVVGIPTLSAINSETNTPANGIGFAIPSSQIHTTITQILGS
jgi:putative serine protease PepD